MRVHNLDRDIVIPHVDHKSSPLQKAVGLRFSQDGRAFFPFNRPVREPIDMLFVPRPLDLAFLDAEMRVIEVQRADPVSLHPATWQFYRPDEPYHALLEVEAGLFAEKGMRVGDRFTLRD